MPTLISRALGALVSLLLITNSHAAIHAQEFDPFGGGAPAEAADPFGDGRDPFAPFDGVPNADPFGGGAPADVADPFDGEEKPHVTIPPRAARRADRDGDSHLEKALASPTTIETIESPLSDIAQFLGDFHKIDVQLDERALEEVGIGPDTPLTFNVKGISLRSALRLMLNEAYLEAIVHDGALLITTPERVEEDHLTTKVYSIRRLLPDDALTDDPSAGEEIRDIVVQSVRPATWEDYGGPGSARMLRNSLVVANTPRVQAEVAALLESLAEVRKVVAASKRSAPKITSLPQPPAWQANIQKALRKKVDCDFLETPLADVVDFLKTQADIPILIDYRALEDIGIGSDTPITRQMKGVSLHAVLMLVLKEMDLTYAIRDEVLLITTPEQEENELETRVFPVADLVRPWDRDDAWLSSENWGDEEGMDTLIDMITTIVRPDYWEDVGGPGSIESYSGCLVISQTRESFAEIEHLLAGLRKLHAEIRADRKHVLTEALKLDEIDSTRHAKLREALTGEVGMLSFNRTRMDKMVAHIAEKHGVPIEIDYRALDDSGIDVGETITATLGGESLAQALRRLTRKFDLKVIIRDEAILITTPEEAESELLTCIYPVADLVLPRGVDGLPDETASAEYDSLMETLIGTVHPDKWEEVGGVGSMEPYPVVRALVISQTEEVQDEVAELLAKLRQTEAAERAQAANVNAKDEAADDSPEADEEVVKNKQGERLYLKVYRLIAVNIDENGKQFPSKGPGELAEVICDLVEPESWRSDEGYYLRTLGNKGGTFAASVIVVRHTAAAHRKIHKLLTELDALPQPRSGHGFGGGVGVGIDNGEGFQGGGLGAGGVFDVPDHVLPQICAVGFGINGGFGYPWSSSGNGVRFYTPVVTLHEFSLPAADNRPAMPLRIYDQGLAEREELQKIIAELIAPGEWDGEGRYLRAIQGKLIVRQTPEVHRKVFRLMIELGAMSPPYRRQGGVCGSTIPVVGERALDVASR